MREGNSFRYGAAVSVLLFAVCLIYLGDVGHGFIKDDFGWIAKSRLSTWADLKAIFGAPSGFFRPIVSLSFALNRAMCGMWPRCYGLTNFGLLILCASGVAVLTHALFLSPLAALFAAALWTFNWHGINAAVLWISGRTTLLVVLFSTYGAAAFIKQRWALAAFLLFAAMLSKEEAVLLPAMLIGWSLVDAHARNAPLLSRCVRLFTAASLTLGFVYYVLRTQSGAFTPLTAPSYYRWSFTMSTLLPNLLQYLDRSATFAAAVVGVLFISTGRPRALFTRDFRSRTFVFGAMWWMASLGPTVFLPVRSSLYALLPSVGTAVIAAAVVDRAWGITTAPARSRVALVALTMPLLLWPIYHTRNQVLVREAELSARTLAELQQLADTHDRGFVVLLVDDRSHRPSLNDAFGAGLQDAVDLMVTKPITAWIDPPSVDTALAGLTAPTHVDLTLVLKDTEFIVRQ